MSKLLKVCTALILIMVLFAACGQTWVCDECGKTFTGKAYYGYGGSETFCEDCARTYWMPLPYQNYVKK